MQLPLLYDQASSLFSLQVSVGTPAQTTQMLVDLGGHDTFVFAHNTHSYLTRPHKFYNVHDSQSGHFVSKNELQMRHSLGFYLKS